MELSLDNGKYTYILDDQKGIHKALRYGEEWRNLAGDNLIYMMGVHIETLQERITELEFKNDPYSHRIEAKAIQDFINEQFPITEEVQKDPIALSIITCIHNAKAEKVAQLLMTPPIEKEQL